MEPDPRFDYGTPDSVSCHDHGNCELCDKLESNHKELIETVECLRRVLIRGGGEDIIPLARVDDVLERCKYG